MSFNLSSKENVNFNVKSSLPSKLKSPSSLPPFLNHRTLLLRLRQILLYDVFWHHHLPLSLAFGVPWPWTKNKEEDSLFECYCLREKERDLGTMMLPKELEIENDSRTGGRFLHHHPIVSWILVFLSHKQ